MKTPAKTVLGLMAAGLMLAAGASAPSATRLAPAGIYVIDGDTIALPGGERVRFAGIAAPEMPSRAKCSREARLAVESRAHLQRLIREAKSVTLHRPPGERNRDRYGRLLRDVRADGHDLGRAMMAAGHARPWTGRQPNWC